MFSSTKRINRLQHRLDTISKISESLKQIDQRFFWYRLSTFLGAWVLAILTRFLVPGAAWIWVLMGMFVIFLVVVYLHRRLDLQRLRYQNAEEWLTQQVARAKLDWDDIPMMDIQTVNMDHPFMNDLNLIGERSLLQLIDTIATKGGQKLLQSWFLDPDFDFEKITHRQNLVKELVELIGFRTHLMLLGSLVKRDSKGSWDDHAITHWLKEKSSTADIKLKLNLLVLLAVLNYVLLALNLLAGLPAYWQFSVVVYLGFYFFQYRVYQSTFQEAYQINRDFQPIQRSLALLEHYPAKEGSLLSELLSEIKNGRQKPSIFLRKIILISSAASLQNNQILSFLINLLLPWDMYFAYVLSGYKHKLRDIFPTWMKVWYQSEALTALANFAYLNPEYNFPAIREKVEPPILQAKGLGHPLITKSEKVVNDFSITNLGEVALISGSNMSGKSTFLRTLGINIVLAYTGCVVNADQMHLSILRLFTCIQVSDSLKDGFSYFYAEVRRLKELLHWLREPDQPPVFYLIDEIFQGTNHEERRIGSLSYLKALVNANGVGAISTHDIELSKLAEVELNIHNYNFQDSVVDGKMHFDYQLRSGPSPTTNALKIMALEGLPIID